MKRVDLPDEQGHFGRYGGVFVAETLVHALDELKRAYEACRKDPKFVAEFEYELKHYVGRPSPVYHAKRWSQRSEEHTSELQSRLHLVCRLLLEKKKKKKTHTTITIIN